MNLQLLELSDVSKQIAELKKEESEIKTTLLLLSNEQKKAEQRKAEFQKASTYDSAEDEQEYINSIIKIKPFYNLKIKHILEEILFLQEREV